MTRIRPYLNFMPQIAANAYLDPSAVIIGQVNIANHSSVWCNSVIRADVAPIIIGENSNIQDLTMLHVTHSYQNSTPETPLIIGNNVTVGHNCCLHACTLNNNILVGMGSTILDNAYIEDNVMIGAGSLVPPHKHLKSGYLYFGNPVKEIRRLSIAEIEYLIYSAQHYVRLANNHQQFLKKETI